MVYKNFRIFHDGSHFVSTAHDVKIDNDKMFKISPIMENISNLADLLIMSDFDKKTICDKIYSEIISNNELASELKSFMARGNNLVDRISEKVDIKLLARDLALFNDSERELSNNMRNDLDSIYNLVYMPNKKNYNLHELIKAELAPKYGNLPLDLDVFIDKGIDRNSRNLRDRVKRFRSKGNLINWQFFITQTYDDKKHTEKSFVESFKKCIGNLHTRYGWLVMGGFERSPENNRLHFHGVVYIPEGQMKGEIISRHDFSFATRTVQVIEENTFFLERFGRNDFEPLSTVEIEHSSAINYCMKYIFKTGCKLFYTRGIPSFVERVIYSDQIATNYYHYDTLKYVLYDDWQNCENSRELSKEFINYKLRQPA